jgi:crossover junction endodeoxyribonuclease RuvC
MKVLGLDPGSQRLGFGLLERRGSRWHRLDSGTIVLGSRRPLPERLETAYRAVSSLLSAQPPDLVVVEECFVALSPRAALVLGQVRGVLLLAIQQAGIAITEYAPRAVKLAAVGNGGAAKEQVQYMVPRLLEECPSQLGEDEGDALAVAWCGAIHYQNDQRMKEQAGD